LGGYGILRYQLLMWARVVVAGFAKIRFFFFVLVIYGIFKWCTSDKIYEALRRDRINFYLIFVWNLCSIRKNIFWGKGRGVGWWDCDRWMMINASILWWDWRVRNLKI
jgi:hypothetical protein